MSSVIITIDGPSASGKSTVSRLLAARLGIDWVSTGIFYRGLAYMALDRSYEMDEISAIADLVNTAEWQVSLLPSHTQFLYQGRDITDLLNNEKVGGMASQISRAPKIRAVLLQAQRDCAQGRRGLVAEGRDCGTVVFPDASLKIYLTADQKDRIRRRAKEEGVSPESIESQQVERDRADSSRTHAPLQIPDDGVVIDTTQLELDRVVDQILGHPGLGKIGNFP